MSQLQSKKQIRFFALLFAITYMVSYVTRINFGAIISEMQSATGFSNKMLSMSLSGSFITYGLGQVVSGFCGDRISPKKLVACGLGASVLMNVLLPLCRNPYEMLAVWSVNGFAQSFMWPPMVKIMTQTLDESDYRSAVTKVGWGSSAGTILVYLLAPVLISTLGWKWVFFVSAIMGAVMIFIWLRFAYDVELTPIQAKTESTQSISFWKPVLFGILIAIVLQGMLRDGVTTWMPTYIKDTYHLSNEISILTGVILPVFAIISLEVAAKLYAKKFTNPILCAALLFGVGAVSALVLRFAAGENAALSVTLFALLTGAMHGVNMMLISMVPAYFRSTGKVSTVSGVLNAATYVGSACATYGIAGLSEAFGWNFTIVLWVAIATFGTALCLLCGKFWKKYIVNFS